jgi:membrane-bound lytic murein transglycosylase D
MSIVIRYFKRILFLYSLSIVSIYAVSLEHKYPSYSYVFDEFNVDESYLYDDDFISFVSKHEKNLKSFYKNSLQRGQEILPMIQGLLVDDGVSDLFIYLSMVESGFSSGAVSPKKAVGLWQFMPATAKQYDLAVYNGYDERYDPVNATSAAIKYLNKLYKQFGKWYLAAMAYNCGEGCLERAIKRAGTDELNILTDGSLKYLPRETRQYIKKILLVAMIGENVALGFNDADVTLDNTLIQVEVHAETSLKEVASLLKMEEEKLLNLNKSIINGVVPSGHSDYKITIPIEKIYAFYLRYERSTTPKKYKSHMISHNVTLGETLEDIAKQYEADKEEIKRSNHLTEDTLLVDSLLVIPVTQKVFQKISE